jgi:hypothetical protein
MDPFEPVVPERRNIPMLVVFLMVAVIALGLIFIWPAW